MQKVFKFSNENLTAYQQLYNFNDARVLSVGGSGDQYFTAILNGAEEVDLFDKNPYFWPYFVTKFYAIQNLSYKEFSKLFMHSSTFEDIFNTVNSLLPNKQRKEISDVIVKVIIAYQFGCHRDEIKRMIFADSIPYLERTRYKELQQKLQGRSLPDVYFSDIRDLPKEVSKNSYDIMLTSNIYQWMWTSPLTYLELLDQFNCPTFQAMYSYNEPLEEDTFDKYCGETPVKGWLHDKRETDYVYTYQKTKGEKYGSNI